MSEMRTGDSMCGDVCCGMGDGDITEDEFHDEKRVSHHVNLGPTGLSRAVDGRYDRLIAAFRHVVMYKFNSGATAAHKRTVMQALAELPEIVKDAQGDPVVGHLSYGTTLRFQAAACGGAYFVSRAGHL
jgi:hypothetical protein